MTITARTQNPLSSQDEHTQMLHDEISHSNLNSVEQLSLTLSEDLSGVLAIHSQQTNTAMHTVVQQLHKHKLKRTYCDR